MKLWKVILATIVIFTAGALAGGILVRTFSPRPPAPKAPVPGSITQQRFQERLKKELQLTAAQTNQIDRIFHESRRRIEILWDLISPEVQKERQEVHDNIEAILTPAQREKFEELLKQQPHKPEGPRRGPRPNTNQSNSATPARK